MAKLPAKFEDFFKLANFFYLSTGMVIYQNENFSKTKTLAANFIFYGSLFNMNYILVLEILYVVLAIVNGNKFLEATMTLSYIGFVVVSNFKMLFVWRKKTELAKFLKELRQIFPLQEKQQKNFKLPEYLRQCTLITVGLSVIYMIAIWTYNLFTITQYLIYEKWLDIRKIERVLPYYMYTPFDWSEHWSYYVIVFSQNISGYTSAAGQISGDILLSSCVTQLIMHFNYLTRCLEKYKTKYQQKKIDKVKEHKKDFEFIRTMIKYHSFLLQ